MLQRRIVFSACALIITATVAWVLNGHRAAPAATSSRTEKSVLIRDIPHVMQKPDFCGEACAEMALRRLGYKYDQDAVFDLSGLKPADARGCYTKELNSALIAIGFRTGKVWHSVSAAESDKQLQRLWQQMHADLAAGIPSIVCTHYDERPNTTEHFRLVVGYDADKDEVIYHEPAVRDGAHRRMARSQFLKLWPLKYKAETWSVIRLRLDPQRIRRATPARSFTDADFTQHMMKLKKKLPGRDFHVVIESPFVVVGDESPKTVQRRAEGTIRWAVTKLKQDYFTRDPNFIIDIWLFKDKASYEKHTKALFGDSPSTPFGYYSSAHRALVMNISTGGGTLVHEIVHPFIESNFPNCPSWFNEGLASLYEQCGEKDGKINGYTNWRLGGLQRAIRNKAVPPFDDLCSTTSREFYNDNRGTNYGQARYLCYYLQEHGKLRDYYHKFRKGTKEDPTGIKTLSAVLKADDLAAFQKRWEAYVLKLNFR